MQKISDPILRRRLLFAGTLLVTVGLGFALVGAVDFLCGLGILQPVRFAWCAFAGVPALLLGIILCEIVRHGSATYVSRGLENQTELLR